jgi:16S rRNA (cytosine1402-N4)-methyltransferase
MSLKEHPPLPEGESHGQHVPVLLEASLDTLKPIRGERYLDLTAGYGGHADRFLYETENYSGATLVDRDGFAIATLDRFKQKGARLLNTDFVSAATALIEEGEQFDIVLVDLGVSSPQLDRAQRGFSFTNSGPLDMRMDLRMGMTAEKLVNTAREDELVRIITQYGEEPIGFARRIAQAIVRNRPLRTTEELAQLIEKQHRGKRGKIHPATRTFQSLRIAVNDELGQVEKLLPLLPGLLRQKGRVGIISFHSLEDRLVKRYFNEQKNAGYEAELDVMTKKPLAGATYDVHNPRSRSAKIRAAVKK